MTSWGKALIEEVVESKRFIYIPIYEGGYAVRDVATKTTVEIVPKEWEAGQAAARYNAIAAIRTVLEAMKQPSEEMREMDRNLAMEWDRSEAPPRLRVKLGAHVGASIKDLCTQALKEIDP